MAEMSALFLASAIVVGPHCPHGRRGDDRHAESRRRARSALASRYVVIGLARAIVVVMDAGKITDTVLFWSEHAVQGLSAFAFYST